jgi:hypothetical protein
VFGGMNKSAPVCLCSRAAQRNAEAGLACAPWARLVLDPAPSQSPRALR